MSGIAGNRDYRLLWTGQVVSEAGFSTTTIAFPLLVLALTGSAAQSGLVLGAVAISQLVAGLPAGALVDRWPRKRIMLGCEAVQAVAAGGLVLALYRGAAEVWMLVVVAVVMGLSRALFEPAEEASLPRLVAEEQVPSAVAMNAARTSAGQLSGTALGGFLFAVGRAVPFLFDVVAHVFAFVSLLFVRLPRRPERAEDRPPKHLGREIAEGLRWVWTRPPLRATVLCVVSLNLFFSAYYLVIIVLATERGVSSGEIGVMAAMLGAGGILGSLAAPYLHRRISAYGLVIGVFWALTVLTPLAVFVHNGYVMGALFAAVAFLPPAANTAIATYQLLSTPDGLRGRLGGVLGVTGGLAAAAGPALGGWLVEALPAVSAVLTCTGSIAVVTLATTFSRTLRGLPAAPRVRELEETSGQ
ncbi:MFS transporter [Amycolatopsis rubida]|uniref:MFS transporter n=1 Tax=Amycolatopsis rubida TaxID=112413 RepID=A0A1I5RNI7_9PSEU|nr:MULTISPECIES: MFS transporter [Amycolatopsis]MYW89749.1 MFS transporter [Amycolatopsis rubida]NEC54725.1 MFS transporter [Amycolatopsis rubida]OAP24338.1 putative galactarate transporter [Amycolatopsis sp. M39]SFP60112.1 Predicted arabinose efflux permease, MFS family [Amycolatopsis rubida]